ncbi:MAG: hypothetical protein ACRES9_08725 [Gammaproteobacteria bacterium]
MKIYAWMIPAILLIAPAAAFAAVPKPTSAPVPASAAVAMPKPPVPKFKQADANHDGKISWNEAKALGVPEKIFKQDDFDKSGDLNETEWMFVRLDMTDFGPAAGTAYSAAAAATSGN